MKENGRTRNKAVAPNQHFDLTENNVFNFVSVCVLLILKSTKGESMYEEKKNYKLFQ